MNEEALVDRLRIDKDAVRDDGGKRRWWISPILLTLVLAVAGCASWWLLEGRVQRVETVEPINVEHQGSLGPASVLDASGYVVARRQAAVSAEVTGKLEEVLVDEGMQVEAGQVLARLNDATERARLALSRARLAAASANLAELRVELADAQRTLGRQIKLYERDLVSRAELDRAETDVRGIEARLESRRSDVEVARRKVQLQQQLVEELTVRAPFAGVVIAQTAEVGEMISPVSAGGGFTRTGVCTIVDMKSLEIEVDVNESYIDRVETDQSVTARLDAYPDWTIPGRVKRVVPAADRDKATVRVRVALLEQDSRILPDMGVSVRFLESDFDGEAIAGQNRRSHGIPATALIQAGDRDYVLVVSDARVVRRAVRVGDRRGDRVVISAGLSGGEQLVVRAGESNLSDGDRVRVAARN